MDYSDVDFYEALEKYGDISHNELMEITNGEPFIIKGIIVNSILADAKFSYIGADNNTYYMPFDIFDIDESICNKIYEFLLNNKK
jgi:hypothetical protein